MQFHGTTIVSVRKDGCAAMGGDGQVTFQNMVLKANTRKVRYLHKNQVLAGFAGSTSDALTLFERFEGKLEEYSGKLMRAAVELGKDWRTDKVLRQLEALLVVADKHQSLIISGNGDVIDPPGGLIAVGSGGGFARAAAQALLENTDLSARTIVERSLLIAAGICVYTNTELSIEEIKL